MADPRPKSPLISMHAGLRQIWIGAGTPTVTRQILTNEKYIGNNIWNRNSFKLKKRHVRNHPSHWVLAVSAFEAIVSTDLFQAADAIIGAPSQRMSDEEMPEGLKEALEQHGFLSGFVINEAAGLPSSGAYQSRFGSLLRAYSLVGFKSDRDYPSGPSAQPIRAERNFAATFRSSSGSAAGASLKVKSFWIM